jgi:uncharacterized protein (TIGR03382 family)
MLACLLAATVVRATAQDVSTPLATSIPAPDIASNVEHDEPELSLVRRGTAVTFADPVRQGALLVAAPAAMLSFEGAHWTPRIAWVTPSDANAAVGPNHIVEVANYSFTIFDKAGQALFGPAGMAEIWQGFPGACGIQDRGDPVALYDRLADRFVLTQMSWEMSDGFAHQCVAVSQTADPLGAWYRYEFPYPAENDYGKIGLWPDAYVFSTFLTSGSPGAHAVVCAFDRIRMLEGGAGTQQCFDVPASEPQPFPADLDGDRPPPTGSDAYLVSSPPYDTLGVFRLHVDWSNPAASWLSARQAAPIAPYNSALDPVPITQPGTSQRLVAGTGILRHRLAYRNFGDHESIVTGHTVDVGNGVIGVRWYELRPDGANGLRIFQQGTFAPDSNHRFMPSVAMDRSGNLAVAYTVSSGLTYPSLRYAARLASDVMDELTLGEGSLSEGTFAQTCCYRWGDYASLQIDPVDDCTFWFTSHYAGSSESTTRISAFRLPGCGPRNDFSLSILPAAQIVRTGGIVQYQIRTAVASGSAEDVRLLVTGLPQSLVATFVPAIVPAGATSTLTIAVPADATPSTATFTIAAMSNSAGHQVAANIEITAASTDGGRPDSGAPSDAGNAAPADDAGTSDSVPPPPIPQVGSGGCSTAAGPATVTLIVLLALRRRRRH